MTEDVAAGAAHTTPAGRQGEGDHITRVMFLSMSSSARQFVYVRLDQEQRAEVARRLGCGPGEEPNWCVDDDEQPAARQEPEPL